MYKLTNHIENGLEFLSVTSLIDKSSFSCCLDFGASLYELIFWSDDKKYDVILSEGISKYKQDYLNRYTGSQLFPFPNRVSNGIYTYDGLEYKFDINETANSNALHGFIFDQKFKFHSFDKTTGSLKLEYDYDGFNVGYPFPCKIILEFKLGTNKLKVNTKISNVGIQLIPLGYGWHPYFNTPQGLEKTRLVLPKNDMIRLGRKMIPDGTKSKLGFFEVPQEIKQSHLDNCFVCQIENGKIAYSYNKSDFIIVELGNYKYFQLYTPAKRDCIAIEPMSCNVDAFNNGSGLIHLKPGHEAKFHFGVSLLPNLNRVKDLNF